ncbi:hypothetical protein V6C03_14030 [Methyloligella sp. 2.7D]|uniref:hypothetical protein n=1 Tax=unclassified Methyloligella TaxID=2625955 RepID=UPI00157C2526|nr:hypothetical protein [Methyloligella sp. GL2]QKP77123.1 hypothetical protein HT051_06435 [Methyloligella sp. GL2]
MRVVLLAMSFILLATTASFADQQKRGVHGFMRGAGTPWLKAAMKDVGTNPTGWSHQWCGRYMREVMPNAISSNRAIDWKHYGKALKGPKVGAVAVMPHHVGIVTSYDGSSVTLVSGNHSGSSGNRKVGVGRYSRSRIVAYRWP